MEAKYTVKEFGAAQTTPPGFFLNKKFIWKAIGYNPGKDETSEGPDAAIGNRAVGVGRNLPRDDYYRIPHELACYLSGRIGDTGKHSF